MITPERRQFLRANKQRGEIAKAVKMVNPKNNKNGLSLSMARNILYGEHWGKWGQQFTDALEIIIIERQAKLELEKEKYANL